MPSIAQLLMMGPDVYGANPPLSPKSQQLSREYAEGLRRGRGLPPDMSVFPAQPLSPESQRIYENYTGRERSPTLPPARLEEANRVAADASILQDYAAFPEMAPMLRDIAEISPSEAFIADQTRQMRGQRLAADQATADARLDSRVSRDAYTAARRANPMGRPFYDSELGVSPEDLLRAANANTTLGGNWKNGFGELDAAKQAEEGLRPAQVMAEGGGTKTIYRRGRGEQIYGGDTTVRNVGGKNMFVDRQPQQWVQEQRRSTPAMPIPGAPAGPSPEDRVAGTIPSTVLANFDPDRMQQASMVEPNIAPPEGGFLSSRERMILDRVRANPEMPAQERQALWDSTTTRVNPIETYSYVQPQPSSDPQRNPLPPAQGQVGDYVRDARGRPVVNPDVAAARREYLAGQAQQEQQGRDVARRNYQLNKAGLRAVPMPDWALSRIQAENQRIANGNAQVDPQLGMRLSSAERIAQANREANMEQARINSGDQRYTADAGVRAAQATAGAKHENELDPIAKARMAGLVTALEKGQITREQYDREVQGLAPSSAAPSAGAAAPATLPDELSVQDRLALESMRGYTNRIVEYAQAQGWSPEKIDRVLRDPGNGGGYGYGGSYDRDWSGFMADWLPGGRSSWSYRNPWSGGLRRNAPVVPKQAVPEMSVPPMY